MAPSCLARIHLDKIDKQKKQHWKDFLDNPDNIWKVARYGKPSGAAMDLPELSVDRRRYQSDEEKAEALMEAFVPSSPMPGTPSNRARQAVTRPDLLSSRVSRNTKSRELSQEVTRISHQI